jgi:predicted nucleic acid-binding protein
MRAMPAIAVVSDASVVVKWFHERGEEDVETARALLEAYAADRIALVVLDLTTYEVGNALLRGPAEASPDGVATVLEALGDLCPHASLEPAERHLAAELARTHRLTFYDAAYAAAAQTRTGLLATFDRKLLAAGLGLHPTDVLERIAT